jgi:acyl carrier protein
MGLDTVELVMEVEDRFHIHISDADAEAIVTVGDLHEYVCKVLALQVPGRCLTRPMFHRLRRYFIDALGVERRGVRPATPVAQLVPGRRNRRRLWGEFRERDVNLPPLQLNPEAAASVASLAGLSILGMITGVVTGLSFASGAAFVIGVVVALSSAVLAWLVSVTARPFAAELPAGCETMAELTRTAVLNDRRSAAADAGDVWSRSSVDEELRKIIVEQLGVKPEQVRPEARFIEDLGAG